jgi:hypothetical protein
MQHTAMHNFGQRGIVVLGDFYETLNLREQLMPNSSDSLQVLITFPKPFNEQEFPVVILMGG